MEVWKDISENPKKFEINSEGVVRRKRFVSNNKQGKYHKLLRIKSQTISKNGYYIVNIGVGVRLVHRLIAIEFIPNPLNKPCINHLDGNKLNNAIDNLEWCTRAENNKHAAKLGLTKGAWLGKKGKDHHSSKAVRALNLKTDEVTEYGSAAEAARELNLSSSNVSRCARGVVPFYKDYAFQYLNTLEVNPYE